MKRTEFKMTPFQHCMNPIICIGLSDGKLTEQEINDLKQSSGRLASYFNLSAEQAWQECEALYHYLHDQVTNFDPRFVYLKVPISCAMIHKHLKNEEGRDYLIRFLEDQATADGELTEDERQLLSMYSTIIRHGGAASGIHV